MRVGRYREYLCRDIVCVLDKGLALLWRVNSREGKVGGMLQAPRLRAASWRSRSWWLQCPGQRPPCNGPGLFSFWQSWWGQQALHGLLCTQYVTALTRQVCHRQGRSGSVRRWACTGVLMGSQWPSVVILSNFRGVGFRSGRVRPVLSDRYREVNLAFLWCLMKTIWGVAVLSGLGVCDVTACNLLLLYLHGPVCMVKTIRKLRIGTGRRLGG